MATPAAARPRERWFTLEAVRDVQVLADGRVAAVVVEGNRQDPRPAPGRAALFDFVRQGDRWPIDDVIDEIAVGEDLINVADLGATPAPELRIARLDASQKRNTAPRSWLSIGSGRSGRRDYGRAPVDGAQRPVDHPEDRRASSHADSTFRCPWRLGKTPCNPARKSGIA